VTPPSTRRVISGFSLRRAVLGILLAAADPVSVTDIVDSLHAAGFTTNPRLAKPPCGIVANLLDYQESTGRVIRTDRGTYLVDPGGWSRSTRWRYVHWRRLEQRDQAG
jgi:hypothetical protein